MRRLISVVVCALALTVLPRPAMAADECDTTNECRSLHGEAATDCVRSQSNNSVCYCGDRPCTQVVVKCRTHKKLCIEIAAKIAYEMARSGRHAGKNDNQFAARAIKIAAHIVDNDYTHDENEGPPDR